MFDKVNGLSGFAAESNEDIGGDVGMLGKAGQCTVELMMVGSIVLHGAAALVCDGHHAINVGIVPKQISGTDTLGDVLAGAGRAVDRADDGDVVARAVTAVAPVVAHPVTHGDGAGGIRPRRNRRRWTIAAKTIISLESSSRDIMNVDPFPRFDVLAGETDDLAIFGDGFAFVDPAQGDLVSQRNTLRQGKRNALVFKTGTGWQRTGSDSGVVLRPQMNSDLRKSRARHESMLHKSTVG